MSHEKKIAGLLQTTLLLFIVSINPSRVFVNSSTFLIQRQLHIWCFRYNKDKQSVSKLSFQPSRSGWVVYSTVLAACGTDSHGFKSQTSTNACRHIYRYMDSKGSAAMLISIQSGGIKPEVNLRITQVRKHAKGIHPGFETQGRCYQKSKTGVSVAP